MYQAVPIKTSVIATVSVVVQYLMLLSNPCCSVRCYPVFVDAQSLLLYISIVTQSLLLPYIHCCPVSLVALYPLLPSVSRCPISIVAQCLLLRDRLVGLVVRRPPRERKVLGSNPACARDFFGVESYL